MKGNQGLEALAALCGGQSNAPTSGNGAKGSQGRASGGSGIETSQTAPQSISVQDAVSQAGQRQAALSTQQSALAGVNQQHWQQALATALQGNGMNHALGAQNLLLSGLSPQGLGESTFSTMQQLALHQYVQAQAKLSAAQQAAAAQSLAFGDPNQQALMMALAAGKVNQMQGQYHWLMLYSAQGWDGLQNRFTLLETTY